MASAAEQLQALLDGPALEAPAGIPYIFVNPPNISTAGFVVSGICLFSAIFAVTIRIYTKLAIIGNFEKEDYLLILSTAMFIAYSGLVIKCIANGAGTHQWDIQLKNLGSILFYVNAASLTYGFAMIFARTSILLQYLRIFSPIRKMNIVYIGSWGIISYTVAFFIVATFVELFECSPRKKLWDVLITNGHCLNIDALNISSGVVTSLSDILILLLTQNSIWRLQMSFKRKLGVSAMFLTGFFACVTSIVRLVYTIKLKQTSDTTYVVAIMGLWSSAEIAAGIVCCCMPVMPKFFKTMIGSKSSASSKGTSLRIMMNIPRNSKASKKNSTSGSKLDTTWKDPYDSQKKLNRPYEALADRELLLIDELSEPALETSRTAQKTIRVTQTYEVASLPVPASTLDVNKRQRDSHMVSDW